MTRQEILDQISQTLGGVPGWLDGLPDTQLEHQWGLTAWFLSDSKLTARDKALVAFEAPCLSRLLFSPLTERWLFVRKVKCAISAFL